MRGTARESRVPAVLSQTNESHGLVCGHANPPANDGHSQQSCDLRSSDGRVGSAWIQRARVLECRARGLRIENQVVAPAASGEVFLRVVDDVVEAEPPHHLQLYGAVDAGDLDVLQFRELDGDRTDPPPAPLIRIR